MASIQNKSDQLRFKGRGPLDSKSLVKTYAELLDVDTWTIEGTLVAYNGMIVAVWLDKTDATNNGIYYFFDPAVTSVIAQKNADVTNPNNWHKISDTVDLSAIESAIADHETRIAALEDEDKLHTYGYRKGFPTTGQTGHMYVAVDEQKTYVWFNDDYVPLGGDTTEPEIIYGGSADE
jgi:hypothetical protein